MSLPAYDNLWIISVAAARVEPPNVDFSRYILEAKGTYETGEPRPYVEYAKKEMRVTEVHNILR